MVINTIIVKDVRINLFTSSTAKVFNEKAFSLLEVVIAISVLAVVSSIAVSSFFGLNKSAHEQKLVNDVATLNSAVSVYVVSGGSLGTLSDPQQVLDKLKTTVTTAMAKRMTTISQSTIDPRLTALTTTAVPDEDFAEWNPTSGTFEIVSNGVPTQTIRIKEFVLGVAPTTITTEARNPTMKFSETSPWLWDYQNHAPDGLLEPTVIALATGAAYTSTPATVTPPPPGPTQVLQSPVYSLPGAGVAGVPWTAADFPLSLTLSNPNPVGSSEIVFSINSATPTVYAGQTLSIAPNDSVAAYANSLLGSGWTNSLATQEVYTEVIATPSVSLTVSVSIIP